MILDYVLHFWSPPPTDLSLSCPAPADGQPADPLGFYDNVTVRAAFDGVWVVSSIVIVLAILACYLMASQSTGRAFGRRWLLFLAVTVILGGLVPAGLLSFATTTALAGSCETNPEPFALSLPPSLIVARTIVGMVWMPVWFAVLSFLLTRTVGQSSKGSGFFHNRGIPYPWFLPMRG